MFNQLHALVYSLKLWSSGGLLLTLSPDFRDLEKHDKPLVFLLCLLLSFPCRSQFAVDVLTTASRGLVFYTGTRSSFMALYLSKGRLVFALGAEGKKLKLKSKEKCNDGKWHMVSSGAALDPPPGPSSLPVAEDGSLSILPGRRARALGERVWLEAPSTQHLSPETPARAMHGCHPRCQDRLSSLLLHILPASQFCGLLLA